MPASRPFLESFVSSPNVQSGVLNEEQQICHDAIWHSVETASGSLFALLAPAGTGKTFLINAILSTARQHGRRVVASATSGLAASLIGYSRTAHTTFKIPVNVDEDSFCKSTAGYKQWLQSIDCFIWDEISMAHRWAIDAVDRSLQDIRQNR
jgi:ABC-type Mn2+/Zn2+ transport system ATPase subunit